MSAPTTTISSLPYELLVAIAVAAQENRVIESNWGIRSTTFKSEWTLSQLSHRFRDVIVGAPALWTLIETDFISEGPVEILKLYLQRSRASKLSVILREPPEANDGLLRERVAEIIVPQVNRIQRLRIVLRSKSWHLEETVLGPFRDVAAPLLEHLEIVYRGEKIVGAPVVMFLSGAPRMTSLKIYDSQLQLPAPLWAASLTHLDLRRNEAYVNQLTEITVQCLSLTHLYLDVTDTPPDANRFHIPTLKFLHISIPEEDADHLGDFTNLFDAPALTELFFDGIHGNQTAFLLGWKSLPHSTFPALISLTFLLRDSCTCESANENLSHTISSPPAIFPALSHLILINQCFTPYLIRDILGPASHLWPLLKTITLGASYDSFEEVRAAVGDTVDSKCQRGEPVPEVLLFQLPRSFENWDENSPVDEMAVVAWVNSLLPLYTRPNETNVQIKEE